MAESSKDMSEFVRKDVYEADQRALLAEIRLGNAEILKKIEQVEIVLDGKIERLRIEVNGRLDQLEEKIEATNARIDAVNVRIDDTSMRISDTHTYMGWGFGLMAAMIAFLVIISPAAGFFKKIFKPSITLEQIDELITARLQASVNPLT
ncbi:MAG: hypothetical protein IJP53_02675 [Synergistaceae bacterium]|nr:hypothetical protein [Synergistaceae bacterium]